jgi:hypothetical protein
MLDRHARLAMLAQSLALDTLRKRLQEAQEDPTKMLSVSDTSRLLDVAVKLERLSRGEPTALAEMGSSADRPLRVTVEETARKAIEAVLGIDGTAADRVEGESEAAPSDDAPSDLSIIDPFVNLPPTDAPKE